MATFAYSLSVLSVVNIIWPVRRRPKQLQTTTDLQPGRIKIDLEPRKEEILNFIDNDESYDDIKKWLQNVYGIPVSTTTIRKNVRAWTRATRPRTYARRPLRSKHHPPQLTHAGSPPRTRINLEPYKDEMIARYGQGSTYEDLAVWLFNTHRVEVSSTKASHTMRLWGIRARQGAVAVCVRGVSWPWLIQTGGRATKARTNLNPYKQEMVELYEQGNSYAAIRAWLMEAHGFEVGLGVLYRQMKRWGAGRDIESQ